MKKGWKGKEEGKKRDEEYKNKGWKKDEEEKKKG